MESNHSAADDLDIDLMPFPMYSKDVKKRIGGIRKLHLDFQKQHKEASDKLSALRNQYLSLFAEVFEKQRKIIAGDYEPTDSELSTLKDLGVTSEEKSETVTEETKETVTGIPHYWLQCLLNSKTISHILFERDKPLLNYLISIERKDSSLTKEEYNALVKAANARANEEDMDEEEEEEEEDNRKNKKNKKNSKKEEENKEEKSEEVKLIDPNSLPPIEEMRKIAVIFTFAPNPYMENTVLTRETFASFGEIDNLNVHAPFAEDEHDDDEDDEDEEEDEENDSDVLIGSDGKPIPRTIQWKEGKEIGKEVVTLTKKVKKGKGKHAKATKTTKEITVTLPSFFDLFLSPEELKQKSKKMQRSLLHIEDSSINTQLEEKYNKLVDSNNTLLNQNKDGTSESKKNSAVLPQARTFARDFATGEELMEGGYESLTELFSNICVFLTTAFIGHSIQFYMGDADKYEAFPTDEDAMYDDYDDDDDDDFDEDLDDEDDDDDEDD